MQIKPLDLLQALVPFASPRAGLGSHRLKQQLVLSLGDNRSQVCTASDKLLEDPIYFPTRVSAESPDAMVFTRLEPGDKGAFVHLTWQGSLMGPLSTTHRVSQRLWSPK